MISTLVNTATGAYLALDTANPDGGTSASEIIIGVLAIAGSLCFLVASLAMTRVADALSRINVLSVATGIGVVLLVLSAFVHEVTSEGLSISAVLQTVVAIGASFVVTTVASMTLARSVYLTRSIKDPRMGFDDLESDAD